MKTSKSVEKINISLIAGLIRDFRKEKTRLTQQQVADRMGVSRSYISSLEGGKENFGFEVFFKYCIAVGAKFTIQLLDQQEWIQFTKEATEKGLFVDNFKNQ